MRIEPITSTKTMDNNNKNKQDNNNQQKKVTKKENTFKETLDKAMNR